MFNLGAVMGGYMDARRMIDLEEAQSKINALRDIEIRKGKREQSEIDAQDELDRRVAERLRSNTQAAAAGGVMPPPQIQPGNPAAAGVTTYPVRPQFGTLVDKSGVPPMPESLGPTMPATPQPIGTTPPAITPDGAPAREPALRDGPSTSPLVNQLDTPKAKPAESSDPLRMHRTRLEVANESGDPKLIEYAAGKYLKALSDDVTRLDNETRQRLAPARERLAAGQLDAALQQQSQQAIGSMVTYRAQNLGTVLAASRVFPNSPDVTKAIEAMFPNTGGVGFGQFQVTDRQSGQAVPVIALVGKDGKPVPGPNGSPAFAIPAEMAQTAALASPLGSMLGKPNTEWQATESNGKVVLTEKTTPRGATPRSVTVDGGGPKPSDERANVEKGLQLLADQMYSKGALGQLDALRDDYKPYADWAIAELGKRVRGGERYEAVASDLMTRINRNIAAGGKPSTIIGGGQPAKSGDPVADVDTIINRALGR